MVEKIIEKVVTEMAPHLDQSQLEHLSNVLYVNFHGLEIQEQCTEVVPIGMEGDEAKIRMFVASKKAVNRQTNTLKQYTREIYNMLAFLGKRIEDITGMDYQILVEADFLVNIYEDHLSAEAVDAVKRNIFRTRTGIELLENMFEKSYSFPSHNTPEKL